MRALHRQPKVEHFDLTLAHQDIGGFQIAVQDVVPVQIGQRLQGLDQQSTRPNRAVAARFGDRLGVAAETPS